MPKTNMKRFTLKMHKKQLMKNPAFRKAYNEANKITKPIKAWAMMELPTEIQAYQFDYKYHKQYSIFPTRKEAVAWNNMNDTVKIISVLITPIRRKK